MRKTLPPWAIGLANSPLGFYFGFITTALPILLASQGVALGEIALVSSVGFSPTWWAFLFCPILDVRFTKKTYAFLFNGVAAMCLVGTVLLLHDVRTMTVVLVGGCAAIVIGGNAIGGWIPDLVGDEYYDRVGAVTNIANLGAAGVFGTLSVLLVRVLARPAAAGLLGLTLYLPVGLLFFLPGAPRPTRSAGDVFRTFFRDLWLVSKRREFLYGLLIFILPASAFALTNLFSGLGNEFHTSEKWTTAIGGAGVAIACSLGCLAGIPLCRRYLRRTVYLAVGLGSAVCALAMIPAPRSTLVFAVGVLAYNFLQGINYTSFSALTYEIVGPRNPLGGTQISVLTAATNGALSLTTIVDGYGFTRHGVSGLLATDALISLGFGVPLILYFRWASRRHRHTAEREIVS
jgi:PAT family beta-lactamase induction signal transducer AmpG